MPVLVPVQLLAPLLERVLVRQQVQVPTQMYHCSTLVHVLGPRALCAEPPSAIGF